MSRNPHRLAAAQNGGLAAARNGVAWPSRIALRALLAGLLAGLVANSAAAAPPEPPDPGDCPTISGADSAQEGAEDASIITLKEGMVLDHQQMLMLRRLIPKEIWSNREQFFFEGMQMQIGACHRRYAPATDFEEATAKYSGQVALRDENGDLDDYVAGLPFPPARIDPETDEQTALKWAWNVAHRYRGAGHRGSFRIVDFPSSIGGTQTFTGTFYLMQTGHRSDLAASKYSVPDTEDMIFAAGGVFKTPFNARHLAWRQFRAFKADDRYLEPDNTFVYVPTMRKMRRASTPWVDGLYLPTYAISGDSGGGGMAFGGSVGGGGGGSINPTAGQSIATSEHTRRGLLGITLRPNAYLWRYRGEQIVLAPLNTTRDGYPQSPDRNFGPRGLSVASDTWDVRYAVVIEGALRVADEKVRTITLFVDYQTQQPLYWISRTAGRRILDVGVLAHRYTGDMSEYPDWPGGTQSRVFEPVGAFFANVIEGGGGWRRESYDLLSTPFNERDVRSFTTSASLEHGR